MIVLVAITATGGAMVWAENQMDAARAWVTAVNDADPGFVTAGPMRVPVITGDATPTQE